MGQVLVLSVSLFSFVNPLSFIFPFELRLDGGFVSYYFVSFNFRGDEGLKKKVTVEAFVQLAVEGMSSQADQRKA